MCHSGQFNSAKVEADSFNFNPVFSEIRDYLEASDFAFGNLETVTAGKEAKYTGYPKFNTPSDLLDALKFAGFDLLTTSNNHSLDRGELGVKKTIAELNQRAINYNGTFTSKSDRDSIRILDIKGVRIAFLAYSYGTNGNPIPKGKSFLINLIDFDLIRSDISRAKLKKPDLVLVHYHFGEEYERYPSNFQKVVVDSTIKMGADIIIGGHPHVLQPFQFVPSKNSVLDSVFVAYSLGNFISNQQWRYSDAGGILTMLICKNFTRDAISITGLEFLPTWVFKGKINNKTEYEILPSISSLSDTSYIYLSDTDKGKIKESIEDTEGILTDFLAPVNFR
jgi:poly-gamma-glutamate synthesis protein (capsule biosynthesis protein)